MLMFHFLVWARAWKKKKNMRNPRFTFRCYSGTKHVLTKKPSERRKNELSNDIQLKKVYSSITCK